MLSVYTASTPLPRVNGPRRRRLTIGSMAVASRMARNNRNRTSCTRHSKYVLSSSPPNAAGMPTSRVDSVAVQIVVLGVVGARLDFHERIAERLAHRVEHHVD